MHRLHVIDDPFWRKIHILITNTITNGKITLLAISSRLQTGQWLRDASQPDDSCREALACRNYTIEYCEDPILAVRLSWIRPYVSLTMRLGETSYIRSGH